ncbi:membrane protein FAM174A [Biomphalaria pfeifferi]|uniref:Membrane protein FAM174A n=1 Tax=Biomphalaria pfeifferi TaxID=112525 RepID=A0AAD8B6U4_BIOPF|nr:membrane protein FAM174A [Biomphalaria pfeifferi]
MNIATSIEMMKLLQKISISTLASLLFILAAVQLILPQSQVHASSVDGNDQQQSLKFRRANKDVDNKLQRSVDTETKETHAEKLDDKMTNCSLPENITSSQCRSNSSSIIYGDGSIFDGMKDKNMLLRTLYVTLGVTGIVIVYFIVRAIRLRKKRTKSRKYGIITQQGERGDMEMEPLGDGNDDDEDYTVFEVNGRKK